MKICQDTLVQNCVSIQSAEYGMRAYINSIRGRAQLESEVPDYLVTEIYKVWGDTPTVTESVYDILPVTPRPNDQDFLNAEMMFRVNALELGV